MTFEVCALFYVQRALLTAQLRQIFTQREVLERSLARALTLLLEYFIPLNPENASGFLANIDDYAK